MSLPPYAIRNGRRGGAPLLLAAFAIPALLSLVAALQTRVAAEVLFLDPAYQLGAAPYLGLLSQLGILVWTATAGIALFTGLQLARRESSRRQAAFLIGAGIITVILMLDDLFMLHENLYPTFLGCTEMATFFGYAVVLLAFLMHFRDEVLRSGIQTLALALLMFATSVGVAKLLGPAGPEPILAASSRVLVSLSDGSKLVGIFLWGAFLASSASGALAGASPSPAAFPAHPSSHPAIPRVEAAS